MTDFTVLAFSDRLVALAAAVAPDHDGAARSDRQVPASAACRRATTTSRPSIRPSRASGSSRRISTSTASAPTRVTLGDGDVKTQDFKVSLK